MLKWRLRTYNCNMHDIKHLWLVEVVLFEMSQKTYHSQVIHQYTYLLSTILCDIILLAPDHNLERITENLNFDISVIFAIHNTHYLQTHSKVPKSGNLHLAWEYSKNPEDHSRSREEQGRVLGQYVWILWSSSHRTCSSSNILVQECENMTMTLSKTDSPRVGFSSQK